MREKYLKTADYNVFHYTAPCTLVCVKKVTPDYGLRCISAFDAYTLNPLITGIYLLM